MPLFSGLSKGSKVAKPLVKYARFRAKKVTSCSAVIAAAGSSERMAGGDKLFIEILGVPVLGHTLMAFQNSEVVKEIVIVARADRIAEVGDICSRYGISKAVKVMVGGPTRAESVLSGVLAVSDKAQVIAVHDGARPCVDRDVISRAFKAAVRYHAVAPAIDVSSTIKRVKDGIVVETVDRGELSEIQTPQMFAAGIVKAALTNAVNKSVDVTDDCMAAELLGVPIHITEGSRCNIKITTREDIAIAEAILGNR